MVKFYLSPSGLSLAQYENSVRKIEALGWKGIRPWTKTSFELDKVIKPEKISQVIKSIYNADMFIGVLPGNCSTLIELGLAFNLCEEVVLVAKSPVYFTQTGPCDAYLSALPHVKRLCCEVDEMDKALYKEYLYLTKVAI